MCEALPFKPYKQKDLQWEQVESDLHVAEIKLIGGITYKLEVEEVGPRIWATFLFINNSLEWQNDSDCIRRTEGGAKRQVLKALNNHRKKC